VRWMIVIGRPRTRRYGQGHRTQDLYRFGLPRWRTIHPIWGSSMTSCAWCWFVQMPGKVPGPPLYSQGGFLVGYKVGVLVGLHGTSPNRITGEF
jgi:hypothetical protein